MIEINQDSLDGRILKILLKRQPITLKELQKELKVKESIVKQKLRELQRRRILALDILPDKIFIRLLREDFHFIGEKKPQKKTLVKKKITSRKVKDYEGMMYR